MGLPNCSAAKKCARKESRRQQAFCFVVTMIKAYLIDDDLLILEEMVDMIPWLDNGFQVVGYSVSPETALDEILKFSPDVVFCDLKMPQMDGNTLIAALKENGAACEFVMVSAYDTFEDVRSFYRQQGFDYILKPVQLEEIQIVLERLSKKFGKFPGDACCRASDVNQAFIDLLHYLDKNYHKKNTLDSLSAQFHLNPNYICQLFAKHLSTTLTCYITEKRMEYAKQMLLSGNQLLKEIAVDCGYSNYLYFFKVFKEYYGIAPKQMREAHEK